MPELVFYITKSTMIMNTDQLEYETHEFHCPACMKPFNSLDNLGVCGCSDEMILEFGETKLKELTMLQSQLVNKIQGKY